MLFLFIVWRVGGAFARRALLALQPNSQDFAARRPATPSSGALEGWMRPRCLALRSGVEASSRRAVRDALEAAASRKALASVSYRPLAGDVVCGPTLLRTDAWTRQRVLVLPGSTVPAGRAATTRRRGTGDSQVHRYRNTGRRRVEAYLSCSRRRCRNQETRETREISVKSCKKTPFNGRSAATRER